MGKEHTGYKLLFPCDICGESFPERDMTAASEDYYPHWISHFYFNRYCFKWSTLTRNKYIELIITLFILAVVITAESDFLPAEPLVNIGMQFIRIGKLSVKLAAKFLLIKWVWIFTDWGIYQRVTRMHLWKSAKSARESKSAIYTFLVCSQLEVWMNN